MLKKYVAAAAVILLLAYAAGAREGNRTLFGAVSCAGQPVAGARITVTGTSSYSMRTVAANDRGVYIVDKLPMDEYIIRALGPKPDMFRPGQRNVMLLQQQREVNFELKLP